ncbi:hypothetical protein GN543_004903 [Salmonella enterica]|nr:hypothetical protein [Salmonella enterica]EDV5631586.1 hypothetical protein [Salmonella enterica subsp. enterica]EIE2751205.1 hypothetical protein [Salmonella enterica subsp. diarizonae serovar 48:i:z]EKQ9928242.1 hypothetical protein [Salmonella enterica subsp. enterica serovar Panama]EDZ0945521.1 hypothetical protein [Salmonella enterica]EFU9024117.1 hypothetical protein [Salmonella enterica]
MRAICDNVMSNDTGYPFITAWQVALIPPPSGKPATGYDSVTPDCW